MKRKTDFRSEKSIYEYLLVINPDLARQIMVQVCKQQFKEHGFNNAVMTPPHITIMNFLKHESREHLVVRKLKRMAEETIPFEIVLEDFGKFESNTSTVYLRIKSPEPVLNVVEKRKREITPLLKGLPRKYSSTPHMTIARGLTSEQIREVWPKWSKETFKASFEAKEMVLLKRPLGGTFKVLTKMPFSSRHGGEGVQGNLF